jgi:hypothetical protein
VADGAGVRSGGGGWPTAREAGMADGMGAEGWPAAWELGGWPAAGVARPVGSRSGIEDVGNSVECGCGVSFEELFSGCFSCNRVLYRGRHV